MRSFAILPSPQAFAIVLEAELCDYFHFQNTRSDHCVSGWGLSRHAGVTKAVISDHP
jgi:hypothetical protein